MYFNFHITIFCDLVKWHYFIFLDFVFNLTPESKFNFLWCKATFLCVCVCIDDLFLRYFDRSLIIVNINLWLQIQKKGKTNGDSEDTGELQQLQKLLRDSEQKNIALEKMVTVYAKYMWNILLILNKCVAPMVDTISLRLCQ